MNLVFLIFLGAKRPDEPPTAAPGAMVLIQDDVSNPLDWPRLSSVEQRAWSLADELLHVRVRHSAGTGPILVNPVFRPGPRSMTRPWKLEDHGVISDVSEFDRIDGEHVELLSSKPGQ